jgi:hypothetical protein
MLAGATREEGISLGMDARMIRHPGPRQTPARRDKALYPALRALVPPDVECRELREELQLAVRQVVMDPPGHRSPVGAFSVSVGKPRNDDCGDSPS